MSKPSAFTWATSGPITTPTSGKMAAGFAPGERGAAQYFNYLLNLLGSWTGWLTAGILDGNYEVTGNLQVDGTLTLSNDQKHGAREVVIPPAAFLASGNGSVSAPGLNAGQYWSFSTPPNDTIVAPVSGPLRTGDRILSITWYYNKAGDSGGMTMNIQCRNGTTNTTPSGYTDSTSGASFTSHQVTGINYTLVSGDAVYLFVQAGGSTHQFSYAVISYDRP